MSHLEAFEMTHFLSTALVVPYFFLVSSTDKTRLDTVKVP